MVAVGAVEDKKPAVVLDVNRCVAVVIAVRPERIGEQRVDYSVKVSPGLPTAVGADVGIVGAIRRVLVVLGLAACGGEGVVDAGRLAVKHCAVERKRLPVKCLLFRRQEIRRGAKPRSIIQRNVGIGQIILRGLRLIGCIRLCCTACKQQEQYRKRGGK